MSLMNDNDFYLDLYSIDWVPSFLYRYAWYSIFVNKYGNMYGLIFINVMTSIVDFYVYNAFLYFYCCIWFLFDSFNIQEENRKHNN